MTIHCIDIEEPTSVGELGVFHLKRLWSRCLRDRAGQSNGESGAGEWAMDNVIYHGLNLPIEETIQFLYLKGPSFAEFEEWIRSRNGGSVDASTVEKLNSTIGNLISGNTAFRDERVVDILSADEIGFWNEHGYLVVRGLFADRDIRSAVEAVWEHLGMDAGDPDTWYRRSRDHGIMVQFFHHAALDTIRTSPRLKAVFAQIWGTSDLWASTDRVSFNPPERPGHEFPGPRLHWDVSLEPPIPFGVQGLVYLTDTTPDQGAFTCVPGFHTRIETWLKSLPSGADPRSQDIESLGAKPIAGNAGDLVIWHQALPHGSSPNRATRPRIVEYVTMFPADAEYAKNWK